MFSEPAAGVAGNSSGQVSREISEVGNAGLPLSSPLAADAQFSGEQLEGWGGGGPGTRPLMAVAEPSFSPGRDSL